MDLNALTPDHTALITGGAAGIGYAVAVEFARRGARLVIVDLREDLFATVAADLARTGAADVLTLACDVSDRAAVDDMRDQVLDRFGRIDILMCNAGIQPGSDIFDEQGTWARVLDVNLGGIVACAQSIVPRMAPDGMVITSGSKQGITTPPGDPAYNVAKAGVKVFTEALAHHLRQTGSAIQVHLLIPGFVFTDLNRRGRTEAPAGAWTPAQMAAFLMERLGAGDFYVLCPDNDVTRAMDEKRIAWAAGDVIENRPALSRWHPEWEAAFAAHMDR